MKRMSTKQFEEIARKVFRAGLVVTLSWNDFCAFKNECNRIFVNPCIFEIIKSDFEQISFREL